MIKYMVVEAERLAQQLGVTNNNFARVQAQSCGNFLRNIEGFVFYAVPHSGAQHLKTYIENFNLLMSRGRLLRGRVDNSSPSLLSNIKEFSKVMEDLSDKFASIVRANGERDYDLIVYAFTEALPMTQGALVSLSPQY